MHIQNRLLQGLVTVSLATCISNTQAQGSVSSFEQSLDKSSTSLKQTQSQTKLDNMPANYDMKALARKLKTRGWDVKHKSDGSLILVPESLSDLQAGKNTSTNTQWQQLKLKFQQAGWSAVIDADGSIRLTPPGSVATAKSSEKTQIIKNDKTHSFNDMQQKLQVSGWEVNKNSDGSILLYPPEEAPQSNTVSKLIASCPGIKTSTNISLPVDSWQEAHDIAQSWLDHKSIPDSSVGKIRKIFNVYIISIVADKTPFNLKHQIAIKNTNGAIITLN